MGAGGFRFSCDSKMHPAKKLRSVPSPEKPNTSCPAEHQ